MFAIGVFLAVGRVARDAGRLAVLDRSRRHLHRHRRPAPDGALVTHKLLSENPEQYRDAAVAGHPRPAGLGAGRAAAGQRRRAVKMGTTVATNALLERKGEPHRAGDHARLRRRLAHRLPAPAATSSPATSSCRSRSTRASIEIDERVGAPTATVVQPLDRDAARARLAGARSPRAFARVRHRLHARLPLPRSTSRPWPSSRAPRLHRRSR